MTVRLRRTAAASLLVAAVALATAACAAGSPAPEATTSAAAETPAPVATPAAGDDASAEQDVLAEREAFFDVQGRPVDGQLPTPQTPEQQEFLAQQRAYVEAQGATWDTFYEGVFLAVALDACETSILNGHDVSVDLAEQHIATSPLFAEFAGDDPAVEAGFASIMVFGTGFLCPADAPQWETAYAELYG